MDLSPGLEAGGRSSGGGGLELLDVELAHLQHGGHDPRDLRLVLARVELGEHVWDDLPREAELVGEPAALAGRAAARRELLPIAVDLLLRLAFDDEREGGRELEVRATVERLEPLPLELEVDDHDAALGPGPALGVVGDLEDLRLLLEDGDVELRGLEGL